MHIFEGFSVVREIPSALATQKKQHKACNYFIEQDPLLSGTIDNLTILHQSAEEEVQEEFDTEMFSDNDTYFNGHEESESEDSDTDE